MLNGLAYINILPVSRRGDAAKKLIGVDAREFPEYLYHIRKVIIIIIQCDARNTSGIIFQFRSYGIPELGNIPEFNRTQADVSMKKPVDRFCSGAGLLSQFFYFSFVTHFVYFHYATF